MLEFAPEPIESMRARYPEAVGELVRLGDITPDNPAMPGSLRRSTFDFDGGLRVVISREDHGEDGHYMHLSGSLQRGSRHEASMVEIARRIGTKYADRVLVRMVVEAFRGIAWCQIDGTLDLVKSKKGVPNIFIRPDAIRPLPVATEEGAAL